MEKFLNMATRRFIRDDLYEEKEIGTRRVFPDQKTHWIIFDKIDR